MFITKRNVVAHIILTLITCGLWYFAWQVMIADDVRLASGDSTLQSGAVVLLLSLITCGIYGIYWLYKVGSALEATKQRINPTKQYTEDRGLVYLLLSIFGLSIVAFALIQSDLNAIADKNIQDSNNVIN